VSLRCPSCGWGGNRTLNATLLERLEDQLEEGMRQVEALLLRMTQRNMRDYAERFTAALAEDGVLPEDF
jgi:deoxycytidine triphosphate deaminase